MESTAQLSNQPVALKDIEELTISLMIKNFNPSIISYDFLNMSGIVPADWELARQPIVNPRGSQIGFKNGVNIVSQPNVINFIEGLGNKEIKDLQFAEITKKYVDKMPNAEYQAVSISPKIIVPFTEEVDGGKNFINNTLLSNGQWRNFGNTTPQASLNLFYQLEDKQLALNINPAQLQQPDGTNISAVLFAGNFNYNLTNLTGANTIQKLVEIVNSWEKDLHNFRSLVYEKFLQKAVTETVSLFDN